VQEVYGTLVSHVVHTNVEWGETDAAGIVYYPNYFRWFDKATHQLFQSLGLSLKDLMGEGIILPILSAHSDFKAPLYYDDPLTITSTIAEVKTRSIRIDHKVQCGDVLTGIGYEWRGWVLQREGRMQAVPIPDHVRRRLEPIEQSASDVPHI
jgi:acyl-CoA thioester hydrolase